jgi:hypothetical protein
MQFGLMYEVAMPKPWKGGAREQAPREVML